MRQWRWTWFGAGLVVFSILIVAGLRGRYLAGEQGVAAWKREMRAKGEKLLVADLAPAPVQADPIAPVLARELKGLPNAPLLSGGPSAMSLTAPGIARVSWKSRASADQWQAWIDQLDKASDELANMRAAIASPSRDLGWGYQNYSAYPSHTLIDFRKSAYWLANATILELHRDNRAAALTNLLALLNLAQWYE